MGKWYQIFRAGEQTDSNGEARNWTIDDLDTIVNTYNEQPADEKHTAPIILGHVESNSPAYGWIDKLKREGNTLLATFKDVANEFKELVNAGRYKTVSASFYEDNFLLRHLAFLGANIPAVKGLEEIQFAQTDKKVIEYSNCFVFQQKGTTSMDDFQTALLEFMKLTFAADVVAQVEEYINTYNEEKAAKAKETPPEGDIKPPEAEDKPKAEFTEVEEVVKLRKQVVELQKKQRKAEFDALMATKKVPEAMRMPLWDLANPKSVDFSETNNETLTKLLDTMPKWEFAEVATKDDVSTDPFLAIKNQIDIVEGKK